MTVKIDKYRLRHDKNYSAIFDLSTGYKIVHLELMKKEIRKKLAERILDELNSGGYEGLNDD